MTEPIKDRHLQCPACGTEYSSLDDQHECRRIQENGQDRDALERRANKLEGALRIAERALDGIDFPGCGGHDHCNCQRCCALRSAREAIGA